MFAKEITIHFFQKKEERGQTKGCLSYVHYAESYVFHPSMMSLEVQDFFCAIIPLL